MSGVSCTDTDRHDSTNSLLPRMLAGPETECRLQLASQLGQNQDGMTADGGLVATFLSGVDPRRSEDKWLSSSLFSTDLPRSGPILARPATFSPTPHLVGNAILPVCSTANSLQNHDSPPKPQKPVSL
ncbi:hypothetical protein E2C01_019814 [Portunus trituberculatus]|uniref:Uncharacterized protein n=1 Tax=Portunus trituberculatus TaxID=210409 RepID=A0A5B7E011_PORTR|nr:hypothetical protein [Portunus trituberculatus]